jgi:hypothetical protein
MTEDVKASPDDEVSSALDGNFGVDGEFLELPEAEGGDFPEPPLVIESLEKKPGRLLRFLERGTPVSVDVWSP